jgi:hypothetical protein
MPNNKETSSLNFMLLLIQGVIVKYVPLVPHPANGHPSSKPPPKRLTKHHFLE